MKGPNNEACLEKLLDNMRIAILARFAVMPYLQIYNEEIHVPYYLTPWLVAFH